jgi:hypothetical protein
LENEPAPFTQADNLLHPLRVLFPSHVVRYLTANAAYETDFSINVLLVGSLIPRVASRQANDTNDSLLTGDMPLQRFYRIIIP